MLLRMLPFLEDHWGPLLILFQLNSEFFAPYKEPDHTAPIEVTRMSDAPTASLILNVSLRTITPSLPQYANLYDP